MTILEALKSITNYPVSQRTITRIAARQGLSLTTEADAAVLNSRAYRMAEADVMAWLVVAPNISEGGVSFSLSQFERDQFKNEAAQIYIELDNTESTYGYKGEFL